MNIIKPKKLKKGDTIAIAAVSGQIKQIEKIHKAKEFFESEGYKVIISESCNFSHRYMAGRCDDECVQTLNDFFLDKSVDAIVCARGGYGTLRLINKINWDVIKDNPKIFAGYSDITILLAMMYKKCGLITFHSAMPNGDFSSEINEYTKNSFFNALEGKTTSLCAQENNIFFEGIAKGILWGGNLASLTSLAGTDFVPDEDLILFLEDLNEPVYKVDKMLTQILNIDKLKMNIKGIALGEFRDIENAGWFNDLISEIAADLKVPVSGGFKITHGKEKDTLPYGASALFDATAGTISLVESYIQN